VRRANILIVDGRVDLMEPLVEVLETQGYDVTTVEDGASAIRLLKRKYFEIAITPPRMPGGNGGLDFRVLKWLSPSTAVIIVNSRGGKEESEKIAESEIEAVIDKPFNVKKLLDIVNSIIETPSILVVQQRVEDGEALRNILVERKCRAVVAKDGNEAIDMVRDSDFDVLLIDANTAGNGGMAVLDAIKKAKPNLGVVAMIDYSSVKFVRDFLQKGASTCLYKPFLNIERLVQVIEGIRSQKRSYPTPIVGEYPHS